MHVRVARETIFDKWFPNELALRRTHFCAQHCVKLRTYIHYLILSSQAFPQNRYYYVRLIHEKSEAEGDEATHPRAWAGRWQSLDSGPGLYLQTRQLKSSQDTPELARYSMPLRFGYDLSRLLNMPSITSAQIQTPSTLLPCHCPLNLKTK